MKQFIITLFTVSNLQREKWEGLYGKFDTTRLARAWLKERGWTESELFGQQLGYWCYGKNPNTIIHARIVPLRPMSEFPVELEKPVRVAKRKPK